MDMIEQKKNIKKNSNKTNINQNKSKMLTFECLEEKKIKSLNSSINLRSKTELEDDDK